MKDKKISLKKLKELRDRLNRHIEDDAAYRYYITSYGKDIETNIDIYCEETQEEYAQRTDANWSYLLVLGRPRKGGE